MSLRRSRDSVKNTPPSPSQHRRRISAHIQNLKQISRDSQILQAPMELLDSHFSNNRYDIEGENQDKPENKEQPVEWRVKTRVCKPTTLECCFYLFLNIR